MREVGDIRALKSTRCGVSYKTERTQLRLECFLKFFFFSFLTVFESWEAALSCVCAYLVSVVLQREKEKKTTRQKSFFSEKKLTFISKTNWFFNSFLFDCNLSSFYILVLTTYCVFYQLFKVRQENSFLAHKMLFDEFKISNTIDKMTR